MKNKLYFVYEDWTQEETPRCFYVGKGNKVRVRNMERNDFHEKIVAKHGIERRIVLQTEVEEETLQREIELIAERKTFVKDPEWNGIGCNFTQGGEGTSGYSYSDESKAKMRAKKLGRKLPSSQRAKMSESHRTPENLEIARNNMLEIQSRPGYKERNKAARRRGEAASNAKITEEAVRCIRAEHKVLDKSERSSVMNFYRKWASKYDVTVQAINAIVQRKTWKHIL